VVDSVPSWLRDEPRSVRTYPTIEALEEETGTQLLLPFYFPDSLAWPPIGVYRAAGDGRPTSVLVADRLSGAPRLVIAQCLDGHCALDERLLPPGEGLVETSVLIGGRPATRTVREAPGQPGAVQLDWVQDGRQLAIRLYGDADELIRIARSMRKGHP
jgi:hypothetical protein